MKKIVNTTIQMACCVLALGFTATATNSYAGHGPELLKPITTQEDAAALKTGNKVAMACAKCKTVQIAEVDRKHGILGWFQPKTKHLCPGCGGYIEVTTASVKGLKPAPYIHTCSKCGSKSAYCCATESGEKTKGM